MSEVDEGLLGRAPCWVFRVIAEADGTVDKKERKRFAELLDEADEFDTDWMKTSLAKAKENLDTYLADIEGDPGRVKSELDQIATAAEQQLSAEDAHAFKRDLLSLGKTIALASGGGVLGIGDKMDKRELEALALLIEVLRFKVPD